MASDACCWPRFAQSGSWSAARRKASHCVLCMDVPLNYRTNDCCFESRMNRKHKRCLNSLHFRNCDSLLSWSEWVVFQVILLSHQQAIAWSSLCVGEEAGLELVQWFLLQELISTAEIMQINKPFHLLAIRSRGKCFCQYIRLGTTSIQRQKQQESSHLFCDFSVFAPWMGKNAMHLRKIGRTQKAYCTKWKCSGKSFLHIALDEDKPSGKHYKITMLMEC